MPLVWSAPVGHSRPYRNAGIGKKLDVVPQTQYYHGIISGGDAADNRRWVETRLLSL